MNSVSAAFCCVTLGKFPRRSVPQCPAGSLGEAEIVHTNCRSSGAGRLADVSKYSLSLLLSVPGAAEARIRDLPSYLHKPYLFCKEREARRMALRVFGRALCAPRLSGHEPFSHGPPAPCTSGDNQQVAASHCVPEVQGLVLLRSPGFVKQ